MNGCTTHLECGRLKVGDGEIQEVVLEDIDDGRDGDLDAVPRLLDDVLV